MITGKNGGPNIVLGSINRSRILELISMPNIEYMLQQKDLEDSSDKEFY